MARFSRLATLSFPHLPPALLRSWRDMASPCRRTAGQALHLHWMIEAPGFSKWETALESPPPPPPPAGRSTPEPGADHGAGEEGRCSSLFLKGHGSVRPKAPSCPDDPSARKAQRRASAKPRLWCHRCSSLRRLTLAAWQARVMRSWVSDR